MKYCIVLFVMLVGCTPSEIHMWRYHDINQWLVEHPELQPLVTECMSDGKITNKEYLAIEKQYEVYQKLKLTHTKQKAERE